MEYQEKVRQLEEYIKDLIPYEAKEQSDLLKSMLTKHLVICYLASFEDPNEEEFMQNLISCYRTFEEHLNEMESADQRDHEG